MSLLSQISSQPVLGVMGAVMASAITPMDLLQTIAMVLGLAIAVVTLWIKILDLRKKLKEDQESSTPDDDGVETKVEVKDSDDSTTDD